MATGWIKAEWIARGLVVVGILIAPLIVMGTHWLGQTGVTKVHAAMPENGGWLPDTLTGMVGEPLRLRLTSDDVVHGFAIGKSDRPPVDILPGQVTEITLMFDQAGTYTFYCTRWCGPNHWRMRGTIEILGPDVEQLPNEAPLYLQMGIDIDAPHQAPVIPTTRPSAVRGKELVDKYDLNVLISDILINGDPQAHSPFKTWEILRANPRVASLSNQGIWDLVALLWFQSTTPETLIKGQALYEQNCAACHGVTGQGEGVFSDQAVDTLQSDSPLKEFGQEVIPTTDFSDARLMLGASPAALQGKILRGGMGTGMPSWGLIFRDDQTWALVDYLWTFQFNYLEP